MAAAAAAYADLAESLPVGGFVALGVRTRPVARGRVGSPADAGGVCCAFVGGVLLLLAAVAAMRGWPI